MKEIKFSNLFDMWSDMAERYQQAVDYDIGWGFADTVNVPTVYKGKGRPRKSDYAHLKHPFDGRIEKKINRV